MITLRHRSRPLLLLPLLLLLVELSGHGVAAAMQPGGLLVVGEPAEENRFPEGMVFRMEARGSSEITNVRFRYTFLPENRSSSGQAEFERGTNVTATFNLRSGTAQRYIPPGKTIRYSWEISDAAGNELVVGPRETSFQDTRFQWQSVQDGMVTVNYYRGTQRDAQAMALVAHETIDKAAALLGVEFTIPVKMFVYASPRDFRVALAHESSSSDPGVLGQAHEPDTFIMVSERLASAASLDIARHELAHLVTAAAVSRGPYQSVFPSWLNEGISVYLQANPNDVGYVDELNRAIRSDTVVPLRLLTSGTRNRNVGLFYGQGYSVVKFLVDRYGAAKFAEMIAAFNRVGTVDGAFREAYGVDQDGVYRQWRESVGLKAEPAARPTADPGAGSGSAAAPRATAAPQPAAPQPDPEEAAANATVMIVLGSVALLALLVAGVLGGLFLSRRTGSS
jgi:hypothetical protein